MENKINKFKNRKINNSLKKIFNSKNLVLIGAILVLVIILTNKNIIPYFQPKSSEAASIYWPLEQITNLPGPFSENLGDIYKDKLVFYTQAYISPGMKDVYLYDITSTELISIKLDNLQLSSKPRIHGNKIVYIGTLHDNGQWWSDVYMYNINTQITSKITNNPEAVIISAIDIFDSYFVYKIRNTNGTYNLVLENIDTGYKEIIIHQTAGYISNVLIEKNRVIWLGKLSYDYDSPTDENDVYIYEIATNDTTQIPVSSISSIKTRGMVVSDDIIAINVDGPNVGKNIFTYNILTGELNQITNTKKYDWAAVHSLWKNKMVYNKQIVTINWPIVIEEKETHVYDLLSKEDILVAVTGVYPFGEKFGYSPFLITVIDQKVKLFTTAGLAWDETRPNVYLVSQP